MSVIWEIMSNFQYVSLKINMYNWFVIKDEYKNSGKILMWEKNNLLIYWFYVLHSFTSFL